MLIVFLKNTISCFSVYEYLVYTKYLCIKNNIVVQPTIKNYDRNSKYEKIKETAKLLDFIFYFQKNNCKKYFIN